MTNYEVTHTKIAREVSNYGKQVRINLLQSSPRNIRHSQFYRRCTMMAQSNQYQWLTNSKLLVHLKTETRLHRDIIITNAISPQRMVRLICIAIMLTLNDRCK